VGGVINKLIKDLSEKLLITSVVVTHDMQSVFSIANRVAMVHKGAVIATGDVEYIKNTDNPFIKQFVNGSHQGPIDLFKEDLGIQEVLGF